MRSTAGGAHGERPTERAEPPAPHRLWRLTPVMNWAAVAWSVASPTDHIGGLPGAIR